jgi:hypothetical protein
MGTPRKIYVSSTSRDLDDERRMALSQIEQMGHTAFSSITRELKKAPGPGRILDECLAHIDECTVYVGIFGWCYGSIHAESGLSYTEHEFDHAMKRVAAGRMDAYLFVGADEPRWSSCGGVADAPEDRSAIATLRAKVLGSGRMVNTFEPLRGDPEKILAVQLPARLWLQIPAADRADLELLPHLCDRTAQVDQTHALIEGLRKDFSTPVVLLTGGGAEHLPSDFLKSLREHRLKRVLLEPEAPTLRVQLRWPAARTAERFQEELRRALVAGMADEGLAAFQDATKEEIAATLGRIDGLVVIDVIVDPQPGDVVREELLRAFVSFFTTMRLAPRKRPVVAIACSERAEATGLVGRLFGKRARIEADLKRVMGAAASEGGARASALPLLHPVRKADVDSWKQSREILALGRPVSADDDIDRLFASASERPMRDVTAALQQYIERRTGGRGADR